MTSQPQRIPIPPRQRWELLRERVLPLVCFAATLAACAWLWKQQSAAVPTATGEVRGDAVELTCPVDGELLPLDSYEQGRWPLFAAVAEGDVVAKLQAADQTSPIEITAPMSGVIAQAPAISGQRVRAGDPLLRIASPQGRYIICHIPVQMRIAAEAGQRVAVRPKGVRGGWVASSVEAIGPASEPMPQLEGGELMMVTPRGLPLRIALPKSFVLKPGSVVEVRFL
jgi:multidrug resistance efflux pump